MTERNREGAVPANPGEAVMNIADNKKEQSLRLFFLFRHHRITAAAAPPGGQGRIAGPCAGMRHGYKRNPSGAVRSTPDNHSKRKRAENDRYRNEEKCRRYVRSVTKSPLNT